MRKRIKPKKCRTMHKEDWDDIDDLKRTIIQAGDTGRAPDLQAWSLGRRVARLEDLAFCFRGDFHQLENARANHDERLSAHHKRLGGLQRRLEDIDQRLDELDNDAGPGLRIEALEHGFDGLCSQIKNMSGRIDALERKMADMHTKDEPKLGLSGLDFELCRLTDRIRKVEQREDAQVNCNASLQWHITEQKIRIDKIEALLNAIREALQSKKEVRE